MRPVRRHVFAIAFYALLAIGVTWPLVLHLRTSAPDLGDPLLIAWILDWAGYALTHAPLDLFHAPIYHPAPYTFAFSEHMTGIALPVLPLQAAGMPAMMLYNVALLLGLAFSGYGAFVLARVVTGNTVASLLAGVIHGFASFTLSHVQHLQIVWSGWLPLILAALLLYWRRPDRKRAFFLGAAFLMNGLTSVHWLLFGGFALVVSIAFLQFADPRRGRGFWLRLLGALAIVSLLLLPFLIPYRIVAETYGSRRTTFEARLGSAMPQHWLVASERNLVWGRFGKTWRAAERELFPGAVAITLMAVGLLSVRSSFWKEGQGSSSVSSPLRGEDQKQGRLSRNIPLDLAILLFGTVSVVTAMRDRITIGSFSFSGADVPAMITAVLLIVRFAPLIRVRNAEASTAVVWLLIGFLGSLGWNFFLHPFLFRVIEPFRATRTPARWAAIAYVGIAILAAIGATRLRRAGIVLLAVAVIEVAAKIHWTHVDSEPAPVYAWLAEARPRAVIELPMVADGGIPFLYLHAQTRHRVPLINGTSGWETPAHKELRLLEKDLQYGDAFVSAARRAGGELLIVHEARLSDEQRAAAGPMLEKLEPVQRFGTDVVFRMLPAPADTATAPRASLPR